MQIVQSIAGIINSFCSNGPSPLNSFCSNAFASLTCPPPGDKSKFSCEPKELHRGTSAGKRDGGNALASPVGTGLLPHPLGDQQL